MPYNMKIYVQNINFLGIIIRHNIIILFFTELQIFKTNILRVIDISCVNFENVISRKYVRFSSKIQLNVHFPIVSIIRMIFQLFNVKIRHGMFFGTRQKHIFVDFAWQVFSIDQIVTQELVGNTRQLFATTYWCGLKREREVNPSICSRNFLLSFSWRKKQSNASFKAVI